MFQNVSFKNQEIQGYIMRSIFSIKAGIAGLIFAAAISAQGIPATAAGSSSDNSDQQLKVLARTVENLKDDQALKDSTQAKVSVGSDGFSLQSANGKYVLKVRALAQTYIYHYAADNLNVYTDNFTIRRARLSLEGALGSYVSFKFQPEFAGATPSLIDAYGELNLVPAFGVRAGKFKPYVGLEGYKSPSTYLFADQALPAQLTPNRDIGIQVQGKVGNGIAEYEVGVFNGAADGAVVTGAISDDKELAGRVFFQPFKSINRLALSGLGLGLSGSYAHRQIDAAGTTSLPAYKSVGGTKFFSYYAGKADTIKGVSHPDTIFSDGNFQRISPIAYWYIGPFSFIGEYVKSTHVASSRNHGGYNTYSQQAWQTGVGFLLTGENNSFAGFKTRHPFNLKQHQFGALELTARANGVSIDDAVFTDKFANQDKSASHVVAWGTGLNWYPTDNLRWTLNFEQTQFFAKDGSKYSQPNENLVTFEAQVAF